MADPSPLFPAPPPAPRLATVPLPEGIHGRARWSEDRAYRYALTWLQMPPVGGRKPVVIGLNPSGASEEAGDRTLVRILGFFPAGFTMLNLFALRATEPKALLQSADPVGPENDQTIAEAIRTASMIVAAWGSPPSGKLGALVEDRARVVRGALRGREVYCLGTTRDGWPRHPLHLPGDTELRPWTF